MHDAGRRGLKGAPPKITTYTGASRTVSLQQTSSTPPDPSGAVNANYIVELINGFFSIYEKQTGALVRRVTDGEFWSAAGVSPAGGVIDPRIVFIPDAGRGGQWLAVQIQMGNRVLMATTNPNDIRSDPGVGNWKGADFALRGNDFTMLGYDANGVYIGLNVESEPSRAPVIVVMGRGSALAWPPQVGPGSIKVIGPLTPTDFGTNLYPVIDQGRDGTVGMAIGVDMVTKKHLTYSLISNGTIAYHDKIEVPPFDPAPDGYRVRQPDPKGLNQIRFDSSGVVAAPMGDGSNIWEAHTISSSPWASLPDTHLGVRWYRLAIDPVLRRPTLAKCGVIGYQGYDFFNPSILSFGENDYTLLSLSRSGDSTTARDPRSPDCGNLGAYAALVRETPTDYWYEIFALRSGEASNYIQNVPQRWGDYSTICRDPDPAYPRRVWTINQYVLQGGANTSLWGEVFASIDVP